MLCSGNYFIDKHGKEAGAARMAELGYAYLDLDLTDTDSEYYAARDEEFITRLLALKSALGKNGVSVAVVEGPVAELGDSTSRADSFEKMTKAMVAARHLGAKYMVTRPLSAHAGSYEECLSVNREYFTALANVAKNLGVTVCLEGSGSKAELLSSPEALRRLAEEIDHPSLMLSLDTAHVTELGICAADAVRTLGDRMAVLHAVDTDGGAGSRLPMYYGGIDWSEVAEACYGLLSIDAVSIPLPSFADDGADGEALLAREAELSGYARLLLP